MARAHGGACRKLFSRLWAGTESLLKFWVPNRSPINNYLVSCPQNNTLWSQRSNQTQQLFNALNGSAQLAELFFNGFIPAVQMVNAVDFGLAFGYQTGQNQRGAGP